ncbi:MAG: GNAT family N-acetyltransferase [Gammaproteobacteria bacterium]
MAPGGWEQVEVRVGDELRARWPFVRRQVLGGTVLGAPPLTKWSGPWIARSESDKIATIYGRTGELLEQLIQELPDYSWFSQNLHRDVEYWLPLYWHGFQIESRVSYVLPDCSDLERVWAGCEETARRQIKKARRSLSVGEIDSAQLVDMVRKTYLRQEKGMSVSPEIVESVVDATVRRSVGAPVGVFDERGQVHAAALFVWDDRSMYYVLGGGDPELRNSGAASLAMWDGIRRAGELGVAFDFEGSMVAGIERFFRRFGACQALHSHVSRGSSVMRLAKRWRRGSFD